MQNRRILRTMPRFSLRRFILLLTAVATISVLVINLLFDNRDISTGGKLPRTMPKMQAPRNGGPDLTALQTDPVLLPDEGPVYPNRPWFMKGGRLRPTSVSGDAEARLFPEDSDNDRIVEQLMYVPPGYPPAEQRSKMPHKKILLYHGIFNWTPLKVGRHSFLKDRCPVDTCEITINKEDAETADAILFKDYVDHNPLTRFTRSPSQVWILYLLECPYHTETFAYKNLFNWTATYRHDSDIVAPYEKYVSHNDEVAATATVRNYAVNKTRKVAWFVSNCGAQNGRMKFAEKLAEYISVDIYGACGTLQCPRTSSRCFDLLNKDYKFYLSFENSNCKDYVTEKFFVNGLGNEVLPIVMGARKADYQRVSPPHSFIHVEDFTSPKELAEYLHVLDRNDTLYNEYFQWKGDGEFINTYFWCRVCAMLHNSYSTKTYEDINHWWRDPNTCVKRRWSDHVILSA